MKRRLILLLMILVLFVVAGCGVRRAEEKLKVGFIFQYAEQTPIGSAMVKAAVAACENKDVLIAQRVVDSESHYDAAVELIRSEQCDIIFADNNAEEQALIKVAKEFPKVEICCAGGMLAHTVQLPNFHNAYADIYQGRYLAGVAAGLKLNEMIAAGTIRAKEAKMGYVGGVHDAEEISGYTAFYLGANSVCTDATMEVRFVGMRRDEQKEKQAALALIKDGCVLISQQSDSMVIPNICEENGISHVAYGVSNGEACPETFIAACRIDWRPYFEYMITQVQKDAAIATDWVGTLENGSVVLGKLGKNVAPGTKEKLETIEKALMYGDLWVFDTEKFTVDGKLVDTFMADVDFDEKKQGDTQVIFDGSFKESLYRSAPYFTLEIDGISLVD